MVQENQKGEEVNVAHQRLVCVRDIKMVGENINTIKQKK
jgi:hypothetical protein